ncbi:hypothetical protein Pint_29204 [Pistacia integerrima]|uniref:Uncharacterized protein n=1 Tax=Pistacia integerrima TaxID=434235 RepID=A0ACC0X1P7_9ROSI|nr:hypothetical protein Pint_29204 [Pistacia integerrima]
MYLNRLGECYYALSRYWSNIQLRVVEDKLMRQKAQLLLDEAASWSLLWYLYGKVISMEISSWFMYVCVGCYVIPLMLTFLFNFSLSANLVLPSTSHIEACQFVVNDHTAQLCLRIVQWLEGLASKALDLESKVALTVLCLQKLDESHLEDVWTLLTAGRLEEACDLCRSAGQPWRVATLCPFGGMDLFPSVEALVKNGKNRTLQAIELESGIGHQWRLWKWASYCTSEVSLKQPSKSFLALLH